MVKIVSKLDNLSYKKYIVQEKNDLPSNYKRLEYIQSTGTQYIDTGIKPKTNMKVEIDYKANELTSAQNSSFFGCYQNSYGFFDGVAGTNTYYVNYTAQPVSGAQFSLNTRYKDIIYGTTFNHNGVDYTSSNVSSCDYSIYLFGRNNTGSVERIGTTKIYNFKLWEDEKLTLDLVPCKNSVNEIGMYNLCSNVNNLCTISTPVTVTVNALDSSGMLTAKFSDICPDLKVGDEVYIYWETNHEDFDCFRFGITASGNWLKNTKRIISQDDLNNQFRAYRKTPGTTANIVFNKIVILKEPYPFYENKGTGTFIEGSIIDKTYNIANLLTPIEYRGVEYLESTGTQFIDTGIKPTNNTKVDMSFLHTSLDSTYRSPLSSRTADGSPDQFTTTASTNSNTTTGFGDKFYVDISPSFTTNTKYNILFYNNHIEINNVIKSTGAWHITPSNLTAYLFGRNYNGTFSNGFKGYIYYCKIYDNNVLVRDLVPVVRKSDSVAGLYNLCGTRKNLFDITTSRIKNVGSKQSDGSYYLSQASVIGIWTPGNKVLFNGEPNKQYTISCKVKEGNMITVGWFYSDGTYSQGTPRGTYSNFTLVSSTSDASKTVVGFGLWYGTDGTCYIKDVMINEGSTKQDYEPYGDFYINQGTGTFNVGSTKYIY